MLSPLIVSLVSGHLCSIRVSLIFRSALLYISRPSAQILADFNQVLQLYPDDPALGSPYDPVGYPKSYRFYGPNNQYKRLASIIGDVIFQSGRHSFE
jgi:hypothetical protein